MAKIAEQKTHAITPQTVAKCIKCGKSKVDTEFAENKMWLANSGHDAWCKSCVDAADTKDAVQEYAWENRKKWEEDVWISVTEKAKQQIEGNAIYNNASPAKQAGMVEKRACRIMRAYLQREGKYTDTTEGGMWKSYTQWRMAHAPKEEITEEAEKAKPEESEFAKKYSRAFNGWYTQRDLDYLQDYYDKLEEEFDFDTANRRDYARKVCKASLQADRAQDDFMAGKCEYSVVKDAMALFDMLSKSANFAACKRDKTEGAGFSSWSELTLYLAENGHPCVRQIEYEPDDVDRTNDHFRHIVRALSLEGV